MKKILYILTTLILLLPNISFGQPTQFCSKPFIMTTQTSYTVGTNLSLEIFSTVNDGFSTNSTNELYYNFIFPNGDTTSLNLVDIENFSVKNNLTLSDSGWYYIRYRQSGCPTTLDSINISVIDTFTNGVCSQPIIATNKGRYEELEYVKLPVIRTNTTGTPTSDTLQVNVHKNNLTKTIVQRIWTNSKYIDTFDIINPVRNNITLKNKRGLTKYDTGFVYVEFIQKGCETKFDSILISMKDTNMYLKNLKYYVPQKEFLDFKLWSFNGDGDSTNWLNGEKYINKLPDSVTTTFMKEYPQLTKFVNHLIHYTQNESDTATSPIFYNTGYSNVKLTFDLSHALTLTNGISSYDTLIINAFYSESQTPVVVYKKGGQNLKTAYVSDTLFNPFNELNHVWRNETINLTQCDTAESVKFQIILKEPTITPGDTKPSNALYIRNFIVKGSVSLDSIKAPTLTLDSLINSDTINNLTVSFPNNHKVKSFKIFYDGEIENQKVTFKNKFLKKKLIKNSKLEYIMKNRGAELSADLPTRNRREARKIMYDNVWDNTLNDETYNDTTKNREVYNDTSFVISLNNIPKGTYKFYALVNSIGVSKYSDTVNLVSNYVEPDIKIAKLTVDSVFNRDKNYILYINLEKNHQAKQYQVYTNNTLTTSGLLPNNNDTIISIYLGNRANNTYTHYVKLINLNNPNKSFTDSDPLRVTVNTDFFILPPSLSLDSISIGNYNLNINIPADNNAQEYGLIENNLNIHTSKITNSSLSLNKTISLTNKSNGKYTYVAYTKNNNLLVRSTPIVVNVLKPELACTTDVISASNLTKSNFTYSFKLTNNCSNTGYKAVFYVGNNANGLLATNSALNQSQVKLLSWTPTNGTPRNGVGTTGNIQLTQSEIRSGLFNRKADPPLSYGNRWYRVDIICTTCTQSIKAKTAYFYVTN